MNVHPMAEIFPLMAEEEFEALVKDMQENGWRPDSVIWTTGGGDVGRSRAGHPGMCGDHRAQCARGGSVHGAECGDRIAASAQGEHGTVISTYHPVHLLGDDLTLDAAERLQINKLIEKLTAEAETTGENNHDEQPIHQHQHQPSQGIRTRAQDAGEHDGSASVAASADLT